MKATCRPETLSRYLDDGLTLPERREVEEHVRSCGRCHDELAALRRIDEMFLSWGARRNLMPARAEVRIVGAVERRKRLAPLIALSKMMPAAVGSSIAGLLVLVSVNIGILQNQAGSATSSAASSTVSFQSQSRKLTDARRTSAIIGAVSPHAPIVTNHHTQFEVN